VATEIIMIGVFTFLMRWIGPANTACLRDDQRAGRAFVQSMAFTKRGHSRTWAEYRRGWSAGVAGVPCVADWERFAGGNNVAAVLRAYGKYFSAVAKVLHGKSVERFEIERARQDDARLGRIGGVGRTLAAEPGATGSDPANQRVPRVRIDSLMR